MSNGTLNLDNVDLGAFGPTDLDPTPDVGQETEEYSLSTHATSTMSQALQVDADSFAKAQQLSRVSGVPRGAVETDPKSVESNLKLSNIDFSTMSQRSPNTSQFLTDFTNATIAQDDIDAMQVAEDIFRSVPAGLVRGIGMGVEGVGRTIEAGSRLTGRALLNVLPEGAESFIFQTEETPELLSEFNELVNIAGLFRDQGALLQSQAEDIADVPEDRVNLATEIAEGVGQVGGQIAATLVNPSLALGLMFGQGVQEQGERQEASGTEGQDAIADLALLAGGGVTAATEKLGIDALLNRVPPKIKNAVARQIADISIAGGVEAVQETVEGIAQGLLEQVTTNPDAEIFEGLDHEAIVAGGTGAVVRGLINALTPGRVRSAVDNDAQNITQGQVEQTTLDDLNAAFSQMAMQQRDPETLREFVKKVNGEENTVFVDATATVEFMADKTPEDIASDPALQLLASQVDEARVSGVAVTIPMTEFATSFAGTTTYDQLRDHMTMNPESVPPVNAEQVQEETRTYVAELMAQAEENVSQYVESQKIYEDVKAQLVDTGRVTPRNAGIMARIVPAWAVSYAKANGTTVEEAYQRSGLTIEGPQTGERARLEGELELLDQDVIQEINTFTTNGDVQEQAIQNVADQNGVSVDQVDDTFNEQVSDARWELQKEADSELVNLIEKVATDNNVPASQVAADLYATGENAPVTPLARQVIDQSAPVEPELEQKSESDKNGTRGYYDPANSVIRLTESSDLSTFLHEFAHFMYEMELNADGPIKADIHKWFKRNAADVALEAGGYEPNTTITPRHVTEFLDKGTTGDAQRDMGIRRAVHEQFARGFETYLMEGKAPSTELRNAFQTFARWLTQIYKVVRGNLRVNIDPEIRQVFDRMLATEEQVEAANARDKHAPLFANSEVAEKAGMTAEEFGEYNEQIEKTKNTDTENLREKLIKEITRTTKKWWNDEKSDLIDEQLKILNEEKVYRARDALRNTDVKLDHATVKELVGFQRTNKLGRTSTVIPTNLRGMTAKGQKGIHPDAAAAMFDYSSGAELLNDLMNTPPIDQVADSNAQTIMLERHGDIMNDGTIEKEADEAVHNEERGKLILQELKALRKGTGSPVLERATVKQIAKEQISLLTYREIFPAKYRKAEVTAAQEAAIALAEGDVQKAANAKARQVLNYYLGMEAQNARNEIDSIVDRMGRFNKKSIRESIQKAEGGYWDQIKKILNRFEFRKTATLKSVDDQNIPVGEWAKDKVENAGDGLMISNAVLDETYQTHWKNVPYEILQGIDDTVKNIEHVARYSNKIQGMQEKVDFKTYVNRWTDHMNAAQDDRFIPVASIADKPGKAVKYGRWAMAQMTKIPYMASWLDGGERAGMSHDTLVQPFTDAYKSEMDLWKEAGEPVMKLIEGRDKKTMKRHNTKFYIPEIKGSAFHTGNIMGHEILAVALNTGNEQNLRKMLLGEEWADPEFEEQTVNMDNPQLQAVLKHMTKEDWELVQKIWDQMDTLYPQLAEVHRKTTGLVPPKVEASPVVTPFGTFKGGYYPLKYDPDRSNRAQENEDKLNAETESMFAGSLSIQAAVNTGATNERTGYYAPIRLSLDVVPNHFQETIHYITHHDAVRQVNKLIRDDKVTSTIKAKLGSEEYAQLKPWLNDIAKDGREAPVKIFWDKVIQRLRFGVTLGAMGFKASTGIIQVSGLSNTIAEVGIGPVTQAARTILRSPQTIKDSWNFAVDNSKVMENRAKTMDREIKNAMRAIEGKRGLLPAAQEASMKHIAYIQTYVVDLPSWHAAYIKSMNEYGDEARAYKYADWVVENVQGSGVTKDMARIMRGQSETGRMFTMFMTFFSALWNMERDLVKGAKSGRYSVTNVAGKAMFLFTIPVLFEMLLRGELGGEDEEPEEQLQSMLGKVALYPVQSVPFIRDIANSVGGDFGYNMSPLASVLEQGTRSIPKLVENSFTDEEITKAQAKGATKFIGAAVGIPGVSQAWATGEHLYDVIEEGEDLTMRQLLFGPTKD